jgi:O-antigen/teichoic acid export membrane protein
LKIAWLHSRTALIQKTGFAFIDQIILSASNFLISILIIKQLSKADYGLYALAIALQMFMISVQNAIVTTPLAISYAAKEPNDRPLFLGSLHAGQSRLFIVVAIGATIALMLASLAGVDGTLLLFSACFVFAVAGLLTKEFLRAVFFTLETPGQVLKLDVLQTAGYLALIFAFFYSNHFSLSVLLLLLGSTSFLVFYVMGLHKQWTTARGSISATYTANWSFGKWSLLGVMVTHLQNYSHLYVIGVLLGSSAVADVSASRLLLMPMALLQAAWGKIVLPLGARLQQENKMRQFYRQQVGIAIALVAALLLYVGILKITSASLANFLFTAKYANSMEFIALWGFIFACNFATMSASYGLQVMKKFKLITTMNSFTLVVTLALLYVLAPNWQIRGALWAVLVGEAVLAVSLWALFTTAVYSSTDSSLLDRWSSKRRVNLASVFNRLSRV